MSQPREIRTYEYVNHPYEGVRRTLLDDALQTFRAATHSASDRAQAVAVGLRVNIAGIEVGKEVNLTVGEPVETPGAHGRHPSMRIPIEWQAASGRGLFPLMRGELALYPITATETQLDFGGTYEPPMGPVGSALDSVLGHRIAEASIHRFLSDVAHHLRDMLGRS
jgi:hypothetical protein